jgi:hypothetical protein
MYSAAELVILAKAYLAATGVVESTLSRHAAGNDKTVSRLILGFDCTARIALKMSRWFDANWPITIEWPQEIQRRGRSIIKPRYRRNTGPPRANSTMPYPRGDER